MVSLDVIEKVISSDYFITSLIYVYGKSITFTMVVSIFGNIIYIIMLLTLYF